MTQPQPQPQTQPSIARKVRFTVPASDTSVQAWLDGQVSLSGSLRVLIRESIERDGYGDITSRPVKQLPRRGRPPKYVGDDGAGSGFDADADIDPEAGLEPAELAS